MFRKRRSALFFDFENIPTKVSPASLAALVTWLEDGKFHEAGGKRKLVCKKVYWNSAAEKHRETFEAAGFEVVLCEKFASMKNGADIRMALDIADTCWQLPDIKEYILFTTDSDFVPVLQRLTQKSKTSAILVNEAHMAAHTAFKIFADVLVPTRQLSEALRYERPKKRLLGGLRKPSDRQPPPPAIPNRPAGKGGSTAPVTEPGKPSKLNDEEVMAHAERAVVRAASPTPNKHVTRRKIEAQLQLIKGFKKTGANAYLGRRHYQTLMLEVAKRNKRIKVAPGRNHSASVMYVPQE
jgi:hypothetical protein